MNIVLKHLIRLKNTIQRRIKMLSLIMQYGNSFTYQKFYFRKKFSVFIEDNGYISIGKGCFFNSGCSITARKRISIGKNCIFGENVKIYDHNHNYKDTTKLIAKQGFISEEVIIEDDCWIASNVVILKGVHIGRHCVIGAGVIVHEDIPSNTLVIINQSLKKIRLI